MRISGAIVVALCVAACGGPAVDYLRAEYGAAEPDATIDLETGQSSGLKVFQVWRHKTKPKLNVQAGLRAAAESGMVRGATYGVVSTAPVQPQFEQAAMQYLQESERAPCTLSNANRIHELVYEFDYRCDAPRGDAKTKPR